MKSSNIIFPGGAKWIHMRNWSLFWQTNPLIELRRKSVLVSELRSRTLFLYRKNPFKKKELQNKLIIKLSLNHNSQKALRRRHSAYSCNSF